RRAFASSPTSSVSQRNVASGPRRASRSRYVRRRTSWSSEISMSPRVYPGQGAFPWLSVAAGTLRLVPPPARALRQVSLQDARRLAVLKQRLAGPRPAPSADGILGLVRELGCLQLDPISYVAKSHLLVTWSRVGPYDPAVLDQLLWE